MYSCKMKKDNLEEIYSNVACYKQYVNYSKTTFPTIPLPQHKPGLLQSFLVIWKAQFVKRNFQHQESF